MSFPGSIFCSGGGVFGRARAGSLGVLTALLLLLPVSTTAQVGEPDDAPTTRPTAQQSRGLLWELGPYVGYYATDRDESIASGLWGGARGGLRPIDPLALELSVGWLPTSYRGSDWYAVEEDYGLNLYLFRLEATYDLVRDLLDGDLVPFVAAGGGLKFAYPTELDIGARDDWDLALSYGLGLRYQITPLLGLRLDLRHLITTPVAPYTYPGKVTDDLNANLFNQLEVDLGLFFVLGGSRDRDKDGVPDSVDQCRDQPEDLDRFQDEDGCPDPDNDGDKVLDGEDGCPTVAGPFENAGCPDSDLDGDGVIDRADQCPKEAGPAENYGCPDTDFDQDGVVDRIDKCPDVKGDPRTEGCPLPDTDNDGIKGPDDRCPDAPEDRDGFEDEDGCPDPDNDRDGVPDAQDKCPSEPETINGFKDDDGCPDKGQSLVKLTESKVEILDKVYFDVAKAKIQKRSFNILEQVALILKANPQLRRIRIEGHTDSQGDDAKNLRLSQARAEAVRDFLVKKGVHVETLEAQGFGETRPIADNKTKAGQAENRRVEFVIVSDPPPAAPAPAEPPPATPGTP